LLPINGFLDTLGAPTGRLLQQARIHAAMLEDAEALVPVNLGYRFLEAAVRCERIDDLGVVVAEAANAFDLGAFGRSLHRAATVWEYLQTGVRLIGSLNSGQRFWLTAEGDCVRMNQFLPGPAGTGRCQADTYTLVFTLNMLRRFIGPDWSPHSVRLMAGDEHCVGDFGIFGDARVTTGHPHSSFTIPRLLLLLQRPLPHRNGSAGETTDDGALCLPGPAMPEDFESSIEQVVTTLLVDACPDIQVTADVAGVSPRTLQRRLAEIGLTYKEVVGRSRLRLATRWLAESDSPVSEIAYALGYTDAANFARAFRRQTGMSPSAYRRAGREGNR